MGFVTVLKSSTDCLVSGFFDLRFVAEDTEEAEEED
jgi:hypothetical protein